MRRSANTPSAWWPTAPTSPSSTSTSPVAGSAWAVGAYGLAFESLDGGPRGRASRRACPTRRHLHLYAVRSVGERVFVAGEQGLLLRSADRGARFEALASPYKGSYFGLLAARRAARSSPTACAATPSAPPTSAATGRAVQHRRADVAQRRHSSATTGRLLLLAQNGDLLISRDDGLHASSAGPLRRRSPLPHWPPPSVAWCWPACVA